MRIRSNSLARLVASDGGATLRADTLAPVRPKGYAVGATLGDGAVVPADASERLLRRTARRIAREYGTEYVGLWRDGARIVCDPIILARTEASARTIGRKHRQLAIFHLTTGRTIALPPACECGNVLTIADVGATCRQCVLSRR